MLHYLQKRQKCTCFGTRPGRSGSVWPLDHDPLYLLTLHYDSCGHVSPIDLRSRQLVNNMT